MQPITLEGGAIAPASAELVVETNPVGRGKLFTALSILAMDLTTAVATLIEIGVMDGTKRIPIDSTPGNFPAKTSMTIYWPCMLREGQKIYAKFDSPTAGDELVVYAHGFTEDYDEEEA